MYGQLATDLAKEAQRSEQSGVLFKYNDALVRSIGREIRELNTLVETALVRDTQIGAAPLVHQTAIGRNKRVLLAYYAQRINQLKTLYWTAGGALPHVLNDADIRAKLAPSEVDFLRGYATLVRGYCEEYADVVDLSGSITQPPRDLHALVHVVRDCGVVHTDAGAIDFQKGQRFMVRRADVEHLISQGILEEVKL